MTDSIDVLMSVAQEWERRARDAEAEVERLRAALATQAEPDLAREAERWRDGPPGDAQPGSEVYDLWLLVGKLAAAQTEPCPYVETSDEGTSYCRLAAAGPAAPEEDT